MQSKHSIESSGKARKVLIGIVIALAALYAFGAYWFQNHYLPNTRIDGVSVAFQTKTQAARAIDAFNKGRVITVYYGIDEQGKIQDFCQPVQISALPAMGNSLAWPADLFKSRRLKTSDSLVIMDKLKLDEYPCYPGKTKAKNASIVFENNEFVIRDGEAGDQIDKKRAEELFVKTAASGSDEMDLQDALILPSYYADSEAVKSACDKMNDILDTKITYKDDDLTLEVTPEQISKMLKTDEDFKVTINRKGIIDFIEGPLATEFDTGKSGYTLTRPDGSKVDIAPGSLFYRINEPKEIKRIKKNLLSCTDYEDAPFYAQKGHRGEFTDYVEVNLTAQKVTVVKNGEVKLKTDCVSGDPTAGNETDIGAYQIEYKQRNYTMPAFNSFVRYWMPFDLAEEEGLHDADWRGSFGGSIYQGSGSHGCVNLPIPAAEKIYNMCPEKTPVLVHK